MYVCMSYVFVFFHMFGRTAERQGFSLHSYSRPFSVMLFEMCDGCGCSENLM